MLRTSGRGTFGKGKRGSEGVRERRKFFLSLEKKTPPLVLHFSALSPLFLDILKREERETFSENSPKEDHIPIRFECLSTQHTSPRCSSLRRCSSSAARRLFLRPMPREEKVDHRPLSKRKRSSVLAKSPSPRARSGSRRRSNTGSSRRSCRAGGPALGKR